MSNLNGSINVNLSDNGLDIGHGCRLKYRVGVSRAEYDSFVDSLKSSGDYKIFSENAVGENSYTTLTSSNGMLHLYYTAATESVRIISDDLSVACLPIIEVSDFDRITDTSLCVMSMDFSHRDITDGHGMSYVIILPDGRFLIFDGGYEQDSERLYRFLCDNNRRPDKKIVIAGWIITHSHTDHYKCFVQFAQDHAGDVELQYFIANHPIRAEFHRGAGYDPFLEATAYETLSAFDGAKIIRPHTGQVIRFCDVELEVVYTHEDHYPRVLPYLNDSSTIIRLKAGGQSLLFMADCDKNTCDILCDTLGDALKSDFIQVNHHGYSGGTIELYQKVAPTYSLWTTSDIAFRFRTCGVKYQWIGNAVESNKYLYNTLGRENCFIADGPVEIIRLPLTDKEKDITFYNL